MSTNLNPSTTGGIRQTPGINVMLMGNTSSGKTHSIRTLVDAGLEVFVLFCEPGMEVLEDTDPEKVHWHYIAPASPSFKDLIDSAKKINQMTIKMLSDLPGINKNQYDDFIKLLTALTDFPCDRTGKKYGAVDEWGSDRALVIDSLSGLSIMAMNLQVGSKPTCSPGDYGIAMNNLERFLIKCCVDTTCHFVLTCHVERETDELTGGSTIMASTLGKKLAPKLPRNFSDVILANRIGTKWSWCTDATGYELKARNLGYATTLPPSFVPLIEKWRRSQTPVGAATSA